MFDPHSPFPPASHVHVAADALTPPPKAALALSRLREAILGCELAPGEKLNEQALVDRFGLGRAATRSALARLEGMRLVEAMPRSGWRVRPLAPQHIRDLIDARLQLEPAILARPLSVARLDALDHQAGVAASLLGQDAPVALVTGRAHDRHFLDMLVASAGRWTAAWLAEAWDECSRVTTFLEAAGTSRLPLPDRRPLISALRAGDAVAAADALAAPVEAFADFAARGLMSLEIELSAPAPGSRRKPNQPPVPGHSPREKEGVSATINRELRNEDPN